MTTNKLSAVAFASLMLTSGIAVAANPGVLPNAAYFKANLHYCAPPAVVPANVASTPSDDATAVYEEVIVATYGGDCDEFFAKEILPRLYLDGTGS